MTEKELSVKLREDARRIGLCDKWYSEWEDNTDRDHLVDMYKRGLDFCIKHKWPSKDFIKHHFSQDFLRHRGILVDDTRSYPVRGDDRRLIYIREYVLLGKSNATIRYTFRPHMCNVWVRDDSHVTVDVKYGAYALVHLFDKASANIKTDLVSKVTVIRHSQDCSLKKEGVVTVKDEFHYLD